MKKLHIVQDIVYSHCISSRRGIYLCLFYFGERSTENEKEVKGESERADKL